MLALRFVSGLKFPPHTIVVTLPIILHAMSVSGLTQQTKVADYQSAGVNSVAACHLGPLSATGSVAHKDSLQDVLG